MYLQPAAVAELFDAAVLRRGMCVCWVMVAEVSLKIFLFLGKLDASLLK